jgi:hypothetical protein
MDEFDRVYGMFGVWRGNLIPGGRREGAIVIVPMAMAVERHTSETHQQKYKAQLLHRWKEERKKDGVTDTDIQLEKSAWEG